MKAWIAVPVILAIAYRAWSHKSLTPAGIFAAVLTATAHAIHPWSLPLTLLIVFFLAGTRVTKVKHDVKQKLTVQSTGSSGGEGARTHVQVLANSGVASVLSLLHAYQLYQRENGLAPSQGTTPGCYAWRGDLLVVGIVANYAAVAADTFSSELGILSKSQPRLVTSWNLRKVPPGTNGGVTGYGLISGLLGSLIIVTATMAVVPFCAPDSSALGLQDKSGWDFRARIRFTCAMTLWGTLGSLLDSFLGGWLQQSVVDTRTGRIVEGKGGKKVLVSKQGQTSGYYQKRVEIKANLLGGGDKDAVSAQETEGASSSVGQRLDKKPGAMDRYDVEQKYRKPSYGDEKPSRKVESGLAILDNNEVNFVMAFIMSVGAMGIASWFWEVPFSSILPV